MADFLLDLLFFLHEFLKGLLQIIIIIVIIILRDPISGWFDILVLIPHKWSTYC